MSLRFDKKAIDEFTGVVDVARAMRLTLAVFGWVLGGAFAWLHLQNFPLISALNSLDPNAIARLMLIFLYFSWITGMNIDLLMQERTYISDPEEGKISLSTYASLAVFLITAFVLLSFGNDERWLAGTLTFFSIMTMVLLGKVVERTSIMIAASKRAYTDAEHHTRLEQLQVLQYYLSGNWVWIRAISLLVLIVLIDIVCFFPTLKILAVNLIATYQPDLANSLTPLLPILLIVMFLIVAEGWQWFMRLRTRISISLLESIGRRYDLQRIERPKSAGKAQG